MYKLYKLYFDTYDINCIINMTMIMIISWVMVNVIEVYGWFLTILILLDITNVNCLMQPRFGMEPSLSIVRFQAVEGCFVHVNGLGSGWVLIPPVPAGGPVALPQVGLRPDVNTFGLLLGSLQVLNQWATGQNKHTERIGYSRCV